MPTPYAKRAYEQLKKWVAGQSEHNVIDGECTPDFSCCMPALMTQPRKERVRVANDWCRPNGFPTFAETKPSVKGL